MLRPKGKISTRGKKNKNNDLEKQNIAGFIEKYVVSQGMIQMKFM